MITKEVARAGLNVCCMQEVKYRKTDSKEIRLNNGEVYEFFWSGYEKKCEAGVGVLIKKDEKVIIVKPDVCTPRVVAINVSVFGFNVRIINAYAPINSDGTPKAKDDFYRILRKSSATIKSIKSSSLPVISTRKILWLMITVSSME